jgi:hypothetical protein
VQFCVHGGGGPQFCVHPGGGGELQTHGGEITAVEQFTAAHCWADWSDPNCIWTTPHVTQTEIVEQTTAPGLLMALQLPGGVGEGAEGGLPTLTQIQMRTKPATGLLHELWARDCTHTDTFLNPALAESEKAPGNLAWSDVLSIQTRVPARSVLLPADLTAPPEQPKFLTVAFAESVASPKELLTRLARVSFTD